MVVHGLRTIFVHIPKTAGQSVEEHLLTLAGEPGKPDDWWLDGRWKNAELEAARQASAGPEVMLAKGPPLLTHLYADEYLSLGYVTPDQWIAYEKITVVRNPWARVVSAWKYFTQGGWAFADFVARFLREPDPWTFRRHAVPQWRFLQGFDGRVVRYERLADAMPGLPERNRSSDRRDYREFYDADLKAAVASAYAVDIERLGYEFGDG